MLTSSASTYFLATLLRTDNHPSAAMAGDKGIPSKVDSTPIEVKYEDIHEKSRKQFEVQLKKEQEEAMRRLLACYGKTQQGVIIEKEKFVMPSFTPLNPSTTTTSTSGPSNVSFADDSPKQFVDAFCSRFEESQRLTTRFTYPCEYATW